MNNADSWVLEELNSLGFAPYEKLLPRVSESFLRLHAIEDDVVQKLGDGLTKRQAVGLGLLARTFQLSISCLVNQLYQNFAGWNCSYRSLLETFFVVDWIEQDPQRFESYFEGRAPGIGRIKTESCGRSPQLAEIYDEVSEVTHVGSRALHLPPKVVSNSQDEFPFAVTSMLVAGPELAKMLEQFTNLMELIDQRLEVLLIQGFDITQKGEVIWKKGVTKRKFGCLGWQPRENK